MRPIRALLTLAALAFAVAEARAQPVTSPGPDSVSVTVYRAPLHQPGDRLNLDWLEGFALITEQRTVTIPAGRATIRFEGVAGGILPESAIVTGLPQGVREKNLDADLLSPRSLYAHSLGRPVTLRRTLDGKTVEERAIIRSGPDGAAILETKDGFIAADCGGKADQIAYDSVPAGLSAKPTLSVETDSEREVQVTVTLSYLAWGFDWQANYVATLRPDGKSVDLFAWVTLANGDVTSFADAETMVVAGRIESDVQRTDPPQGQPLYFQCLWRPIVRTADGVSAEDIGALPDRAVTESLQRVAGVQISGFTVARDKVVRQEELGDLKLYRIPERTTVAAMSQKQVALLDRPAVPVEPFYRIRAFGEDLGGGVWLVLRAQNRKEKGLGLPLPAGQVSVFESGGGRPLLLGEGSIGDKAVNEEVEIEVAPATDVTAAITKRKQGKRWIDETLTVTNAAPHPIRFEAEFTNSAQLKPTRASQRLARRHGDDAWVVDVPANGTVTLKYRLDTRGR